MHYNQKINDVFTPDLLKQNLVISSIFNILKSISKGKISLF